MQRKTRLGSLRNETDAQTSKVYIERKYKRDGGLAFVSCDSRGKLHMAAILREDGGNDLNLFTLRSLDVLPVPHGNCVSDDEGNVHHGVLDTNALVWSTSKDEVVSGVGVSGTIRI